MKKLVITCYEVKNGVITHIGYNITNEINESITKDKKLKEDLISLINKENFISITTIKGTKVNIVKNKYLRTDADKNKNNDLLDCPECPPSTSLSSKIDAIKKFKSK